MYHNLPDNNHPPPSGCRPLYASFCMISISPGYTQSYTRWPRRWWHATYPYIAVQILRVIFWVRSGLPITLTPPMGGWIGWIGLTFRSGRLTCTCCTHMHTNHTPNAVSTHVGIALPSTCCNKHATLCVPTLKRHRHMAVCETSPPAQKSISTPLLSRRNITHQHPPLPNLHFTHVRGLSLPASESWLYEG